MKAITTRYLGATDTKAARILAADSDNNRLTLPADGDFPYDDAHRAAAVALCAKMRWAGGETLIGGSVKHGMVWVFPPAPGETGGAPPALPSLGAKDSACREYGHRWTEDGAYCRSCGRVAAP